MNASDVTVAICTKERPELLKECLKTLLVHASCRVLVVDNGNAPGGVASIAAGHSAAYVYQDRPGLSAARNKAIETSSTRIIAFLDDDCRVTEGWLSALVAGFTSLEVGAVTGPAVSEASANLVQREFDDFSRRYCAPEEKELTRHDHIDGLIMRESAGVGANMAFVRNALLEVGGFPETLRNSGDDDYIFYRVLDQGYRIRYVPAAIVYQQHRARFLDALVRVYEYGRDEVDVLSILATELCRKQELRRSRTRLCLGTAHVFIRTIAKLKPIQSCFALAQLCGCLVAALGNRFVPEPTNLP